MNVSPDLSHRQAQHLQEAIQLFKNDYRIVVGLFPSVDDRILPRLPTGIGIDMRNSIQVEPDASLKSGHTIDRSRTSTIANLQRRDGRRVSPPQGWAASKRGRRSAKDLTFRMVHRASQTEDMVRIGEKF
jgi:hypothetical protein